MKCEMKRQLKSGQKISHNKKRFKIKHLGARRDAPIVKEGSLDLHIAILSRAPFDYYPTLYTLKSAGRKYVPLFHMKL